MLGTAEEVSNIFRYSTRGYTNIGRPAKPYFYQLYAITGYRLDNSPSTNSERESKEFMLSTHLDDNNKLDPSSNYNYSLPHASTHLSPFACIFSFSPLFLLFFISLLVLI